MVGCNSSATGTTALVDTGDVHALMIGAAGVGKTAYFLYPNLEYACASGMSFITSDTKGDLYRHYGKIAKEHYGYNVAVIDLLHITEPFYRTDKSRSRAEGGAGLGLLCPNRSSIPTVQKCALNLNPTKARKYLSLLQVGNKSEISWRYVCIQY